MTDVLVDEVAHMKHGDRRLLTNGRLEIGVFRIGEDFHAFLNHCPHQGGPICQGKIMPCVRERLTEDKKSLGLEFVDDQFHLVCPWHGYEFEVKSGAHPGSPETRIRKFETKVVDGRLYVVV